MKTILLYGELGKRFGKRHRLAVQNTAEALRALRANFPGFERFMATAHHENIGFRVMVGRESLNAADEIHNPTGQAETIKFIPVITGSGGGIFKIILGATLIAASFLIPGSTVLAAHISTALFATGTSMVIGGVASLLTQPPSAQGTQGDNKQSYIFNGPANNTAQGIGVPIGYGRMIIGSVVISAGIETHEG